MWGLSASEANAGVAFSLMLCAVTLLSPGFVGESEADPDCALGWVEEIGESGWTKRARCASLTPDRQPVRGPARLLFGLPIELNRATAATLEVLPGIGPGRAAAIVRERCQSPFRSLDDVQRVHGIGPRTAARLRGLAVAGRPTPECETPSTLPP